MPAVQRYLVRAGWLTLSAIGSNAFADTIRVGVAISLKDAVESIRPGFETAAGDKVELSFGASGQIASQIRSGAPIDVLISANAEIADSLIESKHANPKSRRVVCGNTLVLVVPAAASHPPQSFAAIADSACARLAIGEPKSVPAGEYAMQVFRFLRIDSVVAGRLVYGANVRQVLSYVERGEVNAGIVYRTDALQSGDKVKVVAVADASWHAPIEYVGVAVTASKHTDAAQRFLDFLNTPAARETMTSRGFTVPSSPTSQPAAASLQPSR